MDALMEAVEMACKSMVDGDIEEIFNQYKGRRAGNLKALTTDVKEFYQQCDPEKEKLCLYAYPNEKWEVSGSEEDFAEIPQPTMGINLGRDAMEEKEWLALVAHHSDAWLLSLAFFSGATYSFHRDYRESLFHMINDLPTIHEQVLANKKQKLANKAKNYSQVEDKQRVWMKKRKRSPVAAALSAYYVCADCGKRCRFCCGMCRRRRFNNAN